MAAESFRDILASFLEEKTKDSAVSPTTSEPEIPFFQWEKPNSKAFRPQSVYPAPEQKNPPAPLAKPLPPERRWLVADFDPYIQAQVQSLVRLGAVEMTKEISLSSLKRAHRRLAKRLHPDTAKEKSQENFLALQSAYECLFKKLNDLSCGNESASAPASQRPNAA